MCARYLDVGERHCAAGDAGLFVLVVPRARAGEEAAARDVAARVEAEVERDGAARLGAAADVVELEPHQRLDQRALAVRLVADDHHRWRGRRRAAQLRRQALQLVVGLVQQPPRLLPIILHRRRRRREGFRRRRHCDWVTRGLGGVSKCAVRYPFSFSLSFSFLFIYGLFGWFSFYVLFGWREFSEGVGSLEG